MKYFGEESTLNIKPINKDYEFVDNPNNLFDLLSNCWSKETCAPRMTKDWNTNNMTLGQCSITAFLVQDIFGGEVYGVDLKDGNYHCYNVVDDVIFDLTSAQFAERLVYDKQNPQSRDVHFVKKEKYNRYLLLKEKLNNL